MNYIHQPLPKKPPSSIEGKKPDHIFPIGSYVVYSAVVYRYLDEGTARFDIYDGQLQRGIVVGYGYMFPGRKYETDYGPEWKATGKGIWHYRVAPHAQTKQHLAVLARHTQLNAAPHRYVSMDGRVLSPQEVEAAFGNPIRPPMSKEMIEAIRADALTYRCPKCGRFVKPHYPRHNGEQITYTCNIHGQVEI